jgi:glucose-1-phosphate cytidylyltransferase
MKIPVVIFCGGQGTRMKEETEFRPKPMVSLGGKPILWHIMKIYSHFGFNRFIIALGYKGDYIKDYFLKQEYFEDDFNLRTISGKKILHKSKRKKRDDFDITFVNTGVETLTGERLLQLKKYITTDSFMATYGDGVSNIDINNLVSFHRSHKKIGTVTGVHPKSKWGLIVSDNNHIVKSFQQKPMLNQYVNGGFMVFERKIFSYLSRRQMIEEALEKLIEKKELVVYTHNGYWSAMDTYQDVEEMNNQWKKDPKWKVWR